MMFFGIAVAVLVAVVAWRVLGKGSAAMGESSPEDVLRQRYARGEIDEAELERRVNALHHT